MGVYLYTEVHISVGHVFPENWREKASQFLHLSPGTTKNGATYRSQPPKLQSEKDRGPFSGKNVSLPRVICERKVVTKCRIGMWPEIRGLLVCQSPKTHKITGESLPTPQINSLCHVLAASQAAFAFPRSSQGHCYSQRPGQCKE